MTIVHAAHIAAQIAGESSGPTGYPCGNSTVRCLKVNHTTSMIPGAEALCPVSCALGCGDPGSFATPSRWPVVTSCTDVFGRLSTMHAACAASNATI